MNPDTRSLRDAKDLISELMKSRRESIATVIIPERYATNIAFIVPPNEFPAIAELLVVYEDLPEGPLVASSETLKEYVHLRKPSLNRNASKSDADCCIRFEVASIVS